LVGFDGKVMTTVDQAVQAVKNYIRCFDPDAKFAPETDVKLDGNVYTVWIIRYGHNCREFYYVDADTGKLMPDVMF